MLEADNLFWHPKTGMPDMRRDMSDDGFGHFDTLDFADRPMILVHHPFARHPLPLGVLPFCEERRFNPQTGDLETTAPATTVGGFFGLPNGWPFFDQDGR